MYHVWLAVIIIWNYVLISINFKIEYAYLPFGFGVIYALFSGVFYLKGGVDHKGRHYIYKLVDWGRAPKIAISVVISSLIIAVLVQVVLFYLDKGKRNIYKKYFVKDDDEGTEMIDPTKRGFV